MKYSTLILLSFFTYVSSFMIVGGIWGYIIGLLIIWIVVISAAILKIIYDKT